MSPDRPEDTADDTHEVCSLQSAGQRPTGAPGLSARDPGGRQRMVAAPGDRWQAGAVRAPFLASILAVLAATGSHAAAGAAGGPALAQAPAGAPDAPRSMVFSWTLYPRMWAEIDLRLAAGAETVAEITVEGGEVSWNLHSHPAEGSPATFVTLAQGASARTTVRCAARLARPLLLSLRERSERRTPAPPHRAQAQRRRAPPGRQALSGARRRRAGIGRATGRGRERPVTGNATCGDLRT